MLLLTKYYSFLRLSTKLTSRFMLEAFDQLVNYLLAVKLTIILQAWQTLRPIKPGTDITPP